MTVFLLFLLTCVAGCLTTLYWIPEGQLGRGYFQMNALVVLGLLGLAAAVTLLHPMRPWGERAELGGGALLAALAGGFLYHAAVWRQRWRLARVAVSLALAATTFALLLAGLGSVPEVTPLPHRQLLLVASLVTSSLLLGWSLVTMLLGHWYLVAPRLAFRHLVVFCWILLAVVGGRVVAVGFSLASAASVDSLADPHPLRLLVGFAGQGMFFWIRVLWGLVIPVILGAMSLHCARRRSNQSATGILYVLVVGSFVGEITGFYLTLTTGVPV